MNAVILTAGDPDARTGGSLYHRRIAERAPRFGVRIDVRSLDVDPDLRRLTAGADVVLVDSIVAARIDPATLGRPAVASVHQRPGGLSGTLVRRLACAAGDLRCYRRADAVVASSAHLATLLGRRGVASGRIHVVEPGSAPRTRRTADRGVADRQAAATVSFVCVANLSTHKRPLDLLEAFATLNDIDVSLTLVGGARDADLAEAVARRVREPDLLGRVRWVGSLPPDDADDVVRRADVFVLPALQESYGMAVADALRAGVPAIVARSGNLPNLVLDGADGYLVPPRDVGALASAMRRLALDPARRSAMSDVAAVRAARFPTWEESAERFCAVLTSVQRAAAAGSSVESWAA